jgi:hypothetical protein
VQADDSRYAIRRANVAELRKDFDGCFRIEAGHRFVSQYQSGLLNQSTGDADTLLLAARQLVSPHQGFVEQANPSKTLQPKLPVRTRKRKEGSKG